MKIGTKGLNLIKNFEGFEAKAYVCPAGVLTIGYGTTRGVKKGQVINEAEAEALLKRDVASAESTVAKSVKVKLNQNQFDALVAFVYNVGSGNFSSSTLLKLLNVGKYDQVSAQMLRWNKANGKVLAGLTRRRKAEGNLFDYGR